MRHAYWLNMGLILILLLLHISCADEPLRQARNTPTTNTDKEKSDTADEGDEGNEEDDEDDDDDDDDDDDESDIDDANEDDESAQEEDDGDDENDEDDEDDEGRDGWDDEEERLDPCPFDCVKTILECTQAGGTLRRDAYDCEDLNETCCELPEEETEEPEKETEEDENDDEDEDEPNPPQDDDEEDTETRPADTEEDEPETDNNSTPDCNPTETILTSTADGWVDDCSNAAYIQGSFYAYQDESGASTATTDFSEGPNGTFCISGTAAQVVNEEWDTYWGAGLGLDLCLNGEDDTPAEQKYTLSTCPRPIPDIVGFSFTIEATSFPSSGIRVTFAEKNRDSNTYITVNSASNQQARFSNASVEWDTADEEPGITIDDVESLQFQVPAVADATVTFDFCISDIEPL